jgi:hypothetical protein
LEQEGANFEHLVNQIWGDWSLLRIQLQWMRESRCWDNVCKVQFGNLKGWWGWKKMGRSVGGLWKESVWEWELLFEESDLLDEESGRRICVELGDNKPMECRRKLRGGWLVMELNLVVVKFDSVLSPSCLCCSCLWSCRGRDWSWRKGRVRREDEKALRVLVMGLWLCLSICFPLTALAKCSMVKYVFSPYFCEFWLVVSTIFLLYFSPLCFRRLFL